MELGTINTTQRTYARIAGLMYLFLIVTFMFGEFSISGIVGSGTFSEIAERITTSELRYRIALAFQVITCVSTVLLAFSLYVTLKPVSENLARVSMYWRLGESFMGGVITMVSFAKLSLYSSSKFLGPFEIEQIQAFTDLTRSFYAAGFNISTLFFSVGSTIFFTLFLRSRYIPKMVSLLGILASILVAITGFANLIVPQYSYVIQYGWIPMFISEIATGVWLLAFGIREPVTSGGAIPSDG